MTTVSNGSAPAESFDSDRVRKMIAAAFKSTFKGGKSEMAALQRAANGEGIYAYIAKYLLGEDVFYPNPSEEEMRFKQLLEENLKLYSGEFNLSFLERCAKIGHWTGEFPPSPGRISLGRACWFWLEQNKKPDQGMIGQFIKGEVPQPYPEDCSLGEGLVECLKEGFIRISMKNWIPFVITYDKWYSEKNDVINADSSQIFRAIGKDLEKISDEELMQLHKGGVRWILTQIGYRWIPIEKQKKFIDNVVWGNGVLHALEKIIGSSVEEDAKKMAGACHVEQYALYDLHSQEKISDPDDEFGEEVSCLWLLSGKSFDYQKAKTMRMGNLPEFEELLEYVHGHPEHKNRIKKKGEFRLLKKIKI